MTVLALIGLSTVVIIDVDEQAVITRFGRPVQAAGQTLGPGFHLKLPWPIERVERARTDQVHSLMVGKSHEEESELNDADSHHHETETGHAVLWTEEHDFNPETMMLVANTKMDAIALDAGSTVEAGRTRSRSVAVNLLMMSMATEYRIEDLYDYLYRHAEPERVLSAIAMQELSDYASSVDIGVLMGIGRNAFGPRMLKILQDRCEELQLGIEITFVALQDAHPPSQSDVAKTFQNVVAAEIRRSAAIVQAEGEADHTLTLTAGSVTRAKALDQAVREMDRLSLEAERLGTPEAEEAAKQAEARVNDLLLGNSVAGVSAPSGEVAAVIDDARAEKEAAISRAESKTRTYKSDLLAYRTAPKLFKMRRYLSMLKATLPPLRKYVVTGDKSHLIIEYETQKAASLDLETAEPPR